MLPTWVPSKSERKLHNINQFTFSWRTVETSTMNQFIDEVSSLSYCIKFSKLAANILCHKTASASVAILTEAVLQLWRRFLLKVRGRNLFFVSFRRAIERVVTNRRTSRDSRKIRWVVYNVSIFPLFRCQSADNWTTSTTRRRLKQQNIAVRCIIKKEGKQNHLDGAIVSYDENKNPRRRCE